MASLEVDLTKVAMGQTITVKWRGKPVFIRRRSEEEIESARQVDVSLLRDPQTDEERVQNPEVSSLRSDRAALLANACRRALRCFSLLQRERQSCCTCGRHSMIAAALKTYKRAVASYLRVGAVYV